MRILGFGTYDRAKHPRVGILLDGLAARGHEVTEANRPLGLSTSERVQILQEPWRLPLLALRLLRCWAALAVAARRSARSARPDAVMVGYLGHFDVLLARLLFPRTPIVLDHLIFAADTARDRGATGPRVLILGWLDRLALSCCDLAVVDTDEHRAMLPVSVKGLTVPVGATADWYAAAQPAPTADAGLSVVFFGLFTPLQGAPVIARAIAAAHERIEGLRVTMIGTGQDHAETRRALGENSAVTWIDWVEPRELPEVVAAHDVCLGIFGDSPKAQRVVPNKVYEGLAAGCAVITSDTPPQRRALDGAGILVPSHDPAALTEALVHLGSNPAALAEARRFAGERAEQFTAAHVVLPLETALSAWVG